MQLNYMFFHQINVHWIYIVVLGSNRYELNQSTIKSMDVIVMQYYWDGSLDYIKIEQKISDFILEDT